MSRKCGFPWALSCIVLLLALTQFTACFLFDTPEKDIKAPGNVTGLVATPGDGQVRLVWSDPSDTDLKHFELTYSPGGEKPLRIASGVNEALVVNLTNGSAYTFTIVGIDYEGNRSNGVVATSTPQAVSDTSPPPELVGLVSTPGSTWVDFSWSEVVSPDVDQILITWPGHSPILLNETAVSYRAEGLVPEVEVVFTVKTVDRAGNLSGGQTLPATPSLSLDTVSPSEVTGLVGAPGNGIVTLTWTDPAEFDFARVQVSYSPNGPASPLLIASGVGTCQIQGLTNGNPYTFTVRVADRSGNLSNLGVASQTVVTPLLGVDTTAPVIGYFWTAPAPAYLFQTILLRTRVTDLESAVTLTYDTDDDGVYDDASARSFTTAGNYTVRVNAESSGGSAQASVVVEVLNAAVPVIPVPVVWSGSYGVSRYSDPGASLDTLNPITHITGTFSIYEFDGTNLAGTGTAGPVNLVQVSGNVIFYNCGNLTDLSALGNLKTISGGLYLTQPGFYGTYGIAASTLDGLNVETIAGDLVLGSCPNLSDLSALASLVSIGNLTIQNCDMLTSLTGLEVLFQPLPEPIYIIGNERLASLSALSGLRGFGVYVEDNLSLTSLAGLHNSISADGAVLHVKANPALTGLQSLAIMQPITGSIRVEDNDNAAFTSLAGISPTPGMSGEVAIVGNRYLSSLAALATLQSVEGALTISGNDVLADLDGIGSITSVGGAVTVEGNPLLTDIAALDVHAVGGSLSLTDNDSLVWTAGAVADFCDIRTVGGDLNVTGNALLQSLDGLTAMTVISGNVQISDNASLADLSELDPTTIGGSLGIENNDALVWAPGTYDALTVGTLSGNLVVNGNLLLQSLDGLGIARIIGGVSVTNNAALASLDGLAALTADANLSSLTVTNNSLLPDLTGLEDITSILGPVDISGNNDLAALTGLGNLVSVLGNFGLSNNTQLASIGALGSLQTVLGTFTIQDNPGLGALTGLEALASVQGNLTLWDNSSLSDVSALAGVALTNGSLRLRGNPSLTSLAGMTGVSITGGDLLIGDRDVSGTYLVSLDGLDNFRMVNGSISICNSDSLTSLSALSTLTADSQVLDVVVHANISLVALTGLESVDGIRNLEISGNDSLSSISVFGDNEDGFEISSLLGSLTVTDNASLPDLQGLHLITTIGGAVHIGSNTSLLRLDLSALATIGSYIYYGWTGGYNDYLYASLYVYGNPSLVNVTDDPALGLGLDALATAPNVCAFGNNSSLLPLAATELDPLTGRGLTVSYW